MTNADYDDLIGAPYRQTPNLDEARRFLDALAPGEQVTFQTFDDTPAKRPMLAHTRHGTLEEHADFLARMNAKGAGVFVTVNATDGKGRKLGNVTRPRALFADFDHPAPDTLERLRADALPPSIVVESSAGKLHAYWPSDALELAAFKALQQRVASTWGSDPSVCDLPRVMRLPGFLHQKGEPQLTRLIEALGKRYGPELRSRYSASTANESTTADDDDTADLLALLPTRVGLAATFQSLVDGVNVHENGRDLVARLLHDGMPESAIRALFTGIIAPVVEDARGGARATELNGSELDRMIEGAKAKGYAPIEADGPALEWVETGDLMDADIPPFRFLFEPLLPRGNVTLLAADGGTGKSTLALALAAHVACGKAWDGLPTVQGRALFVSLEDPANVCRLRLRDVIRAYDLDAGAVEQGMRIVDGTKGTGALAAPRDGRLYPTPVFIELMGLVRRETFDLIVIDNASDAFAGNENDRQEVRTFIRLLGQIARMTTAAVLLLAHVDKATVRAAAKTSGSMYSGSTAWNNSVRSRLGMFRGEDGALTLVHEKSNLAKLLERQIRMDFVDAVPLPVSMIEGYAERVDTTEKRDAETILALMRDAIANGMDVSAATSGSSTTWHTLYAMVGAPDDWKTKEGKSRFKRALVRLETAGRLRKETYKTGHRNTRTRFVPTGIADLDF